MENKPYYTSESDGDSSSSKDNKKSSDFSFSGYRPAEHAPAPQAERRIPAAPAIEGVISWRDRREEELRHNDKEDGSSKAESDSEDSDSEKDDSKSSKKTTAKPQPLPPIQHNAVHSLVEAQIVPNAESQQEDGEDTEDAADNKQPSAASAPFTFPRASEFRPPVAAEASQEEDAVNHADETHVPRATTTPRAFVAPAPMPPVAAPRSFEAGAPVQQEADAEPATEDDNQDYFTPAPTMGAVQGPAQANVYPGAAQSYEDEDDTDPYAQPIAAGGGQPPVPPVTQHALYNQPPNPNYAYANQYMHPGGPMANQYNAAPSNANMAPAAPVMPIEHPHSHREPLAAAVGIGLIAEHFGRKRADKKLEKRVNERTDKLFDKQGGQYAAAQQRLESQQRTFTNEQQYQASEMQRMQQAQAQAQERFTAAPSAEAYATRPVPTVESAPNAGPGYAPAGAEAFRPLPGQHNQQPGHYGPEARPQAPPAPKAEQMPQDAAEMQGVTLNAHEHVKSSNWHNIVVDDQGREIVGKINYGEGFRGEQRHNLMPTIKDDTQSDSNGQQHQAGGSAGPSGSFGMGGAPGSMYPGALPSGMTNPTLPQGQPTHADPQHQLEASNQPTTNMTNPWFWIMLLLIIAAFFTAALV